MHTYRVKLTVPIYGLGAWSEEGYGYFLDIRAFSAEDALVIIRTKLRYRNYQESCIEDISCLEEGK